MGGIGFAVVGQGIKNRKFQSQKSSTGTTLKSVISSLGNLGPLDMRPVDRAGPVTGLNFALDSYEKFQPVSEMRKSQRS